MAPMATCAYEPCSLIFEAKRATQKFHHPSCRKAFWHQHHHGGVHKCPLCGALHDAEEAAVLDALEMLARTECWPTARDQVQVIAIDALEAFIARRRAISAP